MGNICWKEIKGHTGKLGQGYYSSDAKKTMVKFLNKEDPGYRHKMVLSPKYPKLYIVLRCKK